MHRHHHRWGLAAVVVAFLATPAVAETWKARAELIKSKSAEGCNERLSVYTLSLEGTKFAAADVDGKQFTIDIPDNGIIKEDYRSPGGARLEMSGNVKTRHLEIYNNNRGCFYNLVVEK
jgi:hypothetical protein